MGFLRKFFGIGNSQQTQALNPQQRAARTFQSLGNYIRNNDPKGFKKALRNAIREGFDINHVEKTGRYFGSGSPIYSTIWDRQSIINFYRDESMLDLLVEVGADYPVQHLPEAIDANYPLPVIKKMWDMTFEKPRRERTFCEEKLLDTDTYRSSAISNSIVWIYNLFLGDKELGYKYNKRREITWPKWLREETRNKALTKDDERNIFDIFHFFIENGSFDEHIEKDHLPDEMVYRRLKWNRKILAGSRWTMLKILISGFVTIGGDEETSILDTETTKLEILNIPTFFERDPFSLNLLNRYTPYGNDSCENRNWRALTGLRPKTIDMSKFDEVFEENWELCENMIRIKIEKYFFERKLYKYIRDYRDNPEFYLKDERYKNCDFPAKECIKDYLRIDEQEILSHRFYKYATEDIKLELKQQIYWYYVNIMLEAVTREISPWVAGSKEKTEARKQEMIKLAEEIKGGPINMEKINTLNLRTTDSMWNFIRLCDVEEDDIACLMTAGVMLSDWYKQNKDVLVEVDKKMRKEYVELVARGQRFICGHNAFYQANPLYNTIASPSVNERKKSIENGHDWRRFGTMFKDTTRWRLYRKQPNWGTTEYFEDYLKKYNKQWQDVWTKYYRDPSVEKVEKHNDLAYCRQEIRYVLPFRPYEPPYLFWETLKIPEIQELAKMPTLEEWEEALEPYKKQVEIITGVKNHGYIKWDEQELIEQIGKIRIEKPKIPDETWYVLPVDAVIPKDLIPAHMENFNKQLAEELKAIKEKETQETEEKDR